MSHATRRKKTNGRHRYLIYEIGILCTIGMGILCAMALMSHRETDSAWLYCTEHAFIYNAAGPIGAWISDILLACFGCFAYAWIAVCFYGTWRFYVSGYRHTPHISMPLLVLGLLCVCTSFCGLCALHLHTSNIQKAGGILGSAISDALVRSVHIWGSDLILILLLILGLVVLFGTAWMKRCAFFFVVCGAYCVRFLRSRLTSDGTPRIPTQYTVWRENDLKTHPLEPHPVQTDVLYSEHKTSRSVVMCHGQAHTPPLMLLDPPQALHPHAIDRAPLDVRSHEIEERLLDFHIEATVIKIHSGPVVTRYELKLAAGIKVSRVVGLMKDLARSLSVPSVRVVEIISGTSFIGLELPNADRETVCIREIFSSSAYQETPFILPLALGKDISGQPVVVDLAKMPHVLVAGTTGSGKSVGLNAMLLSLLYHATSEHVRLLLIDPKMLELSVYETIPHLLAPVVTDMHHAVHALAWCVTEMERRYKKMSELKVRHIAGYNAKIKDTTDDPFHLACTPLPYIVIVVDELADMMAVVGKQVETLIARLAQQARAAGIHLILATQRPSVDVVTGLIKASIPTRIAFQMSSRIDSRTVLDQQGAEQLLGHGDMLYLPPGSGTPMRVHGAYVQDEEVHRVVEFLRAQGAPHYASDLLRETTDSD